MKKKEITIEELEAFINQLNFVIPSDVGTKIPFIVIHNDGDMEAAFSEAKAELNDILNSIKNARE